VIAPFQKVSGTGKPVQTRSVRSVRDQPPISQIRADQRCQDQAAQDAEQLDDGRQVAVAQGVGRELSRKTRWFDRFAHIHDPHTDGMSVTHTFG
jgi:hypothetical protein